MGHLKGHQPPAILDDHTLGVQEAQRVLSARPIAHHQWQPCLLATAFPGPLRSRQRWPPGRGWDQELCTLSVQVPRRPRDVGIGTDAPPVLPGRHRQRGRLVPGTRPRCSERPHCGSEMKQPKVQQAHGLRRVPGGCAAGLPSGTLTRLSPPYDRRPDARPPVRDARRRCAPAVATPRARLRVRRATLAVQSGQVLALPARPLSRSP